MKQHFFLSSYPGPALELFFEYIIPTGTQTRHPRHCAIEEGYNGDCFIELSGRDQPTSIDTQINESISDLLGCCVGNPVIFYVRSVTQRKLPRTVVPNAPCGIFEAIRVIRSTKVMKFPS